jgi:hypothetical protein
MKLGDMLSRGVKKRLIAVASEPYQEMSPVERVKKAEEFVARHNLAPKIAEFIDAQARHLCRKPIPLGKQSTASWIIGHANGVMMMQPIDPMRALRISAGDVLSYYGLKIRRADAEKRFFHFINPAYKKPAVKRAAA